MSLVYCFLILNLWIFKASSLHPGSRALLRAFADYNGGGTDMKDYAVELNATNFDVLLKDTPATYAIVEFFAHWSLLAEITRLVYFALRFCISSRSFIFAALHTIFQPHYEKVARLFNRPNVVHPGIVLMARVDCALKINTKLCVKFSVNHYPMLFWGPPTKFSAGWNSDQAKSNLQVIADGRTADRLLNWINKKIVHMAWMMKILKTSIFHQIYQILDRLLELCMMWRRQLQLPLTSF